MTTDLYLGVGHGVEPNGVFDPGATAPDGTQEHTLNTAVCTAAAAALTRSGVSYVWESNAGAGHDVDYRGSVLAVNALGPKIAVEVHFDSANAGRGGFGIYVSNEGQKLATTIDRHFGAVGLPVRGSYHDVRGLWFLKGTHCPAVIYECDRTMAQPDPNILIKMGEAIAAGICEYLGVNHQPPAPPIGGPIVPDYNVVIIGNVVSDFFPAEGGHVQFTDAGRVYAWGAGHYCGAPGDPEQENVYHWIGGNRKGAHIGPPDPVLDKGFESAYYVCVDTAGERYRFNKPA